MSLAAEMATRISLPETYRPSVERTKLQSLTYRG